MTLPFAVRSTRARLLRPCATSNAVRDRRFEPETRKSLKKPKRIMKRLTESVPEARDARFPMDLGEQLAGLLASKAVLLTTLSGGSSSLRQAAHAVQGRQAVKLFFDPSKLGAAPQRPPSEQTINLLQRVCKRASVFVLMDFLRIPDLARMQKEALQAIARAQGVILRSCEQPLDLRVLKNVPRLALRDCTAVSGLAELANLRYLRVGNCGEITTLPAVRWGATVIIDQKDIGQMSLGGLELAHSVALAGNKYWSLSPHDLSPLAKVHRVRLNGMVVADLRPLRNAYEVSLTDLELPPNYSFQNVHGLEVCECYAEDDQAPLFFPDGVVCLHLQMCYGLGIVQIPESVERLSVWQSTDYKVLDMSAPVDASWVAILGIGDWDSLQALRGVKHLILSELYENDQILSTLDTATSKLETLELHDCAYIDVSHVRGPRKVIISKFRDIVGGEGLCANVPRVIINGVEMSEAPPEELRNEACKDESESASSSHGSLVCRQFWNPGQDLAGQWMS